jgi:hypothetical protein
MQGEVLTTPEAEVEPAAQELMDPTPLMEVRVYRFQE